MNFLENIQAAFQAQPTDCIHTARAEALQSFQQQGIPSSRNEEWKYTPVKNFLPKEIGLKKEQNKAEIAYLCPIENAIQIYFVNGVFQKIENNKQPTESVTIASFQEVLKTENTVFKSYFNQTQTTAKNSFFDLNTALAQDGIFIHLAKGAICTQPVFIQHLFTENVVPNLIQIRNLIVAEEGSQITVIEDYKSASIAYCNTVSEIFCQPHAKLSWNLLQTDCKQMTALYHLENKCETGSHFDFSAISTQVNFARNNIHSTLLGQKATNHLKGLVIARGKSLIDNHVASNHQAPHCESYQAFKSILMDESVHVFNGKILVALDAQKTNAYQSSKAILLSEDASIYSKPQLEIFADDVKCSHGAAIGQVKANELFYLMARGIDKDTAKGILTFAFANEIIQQIKLESLRDYLTAGIAESLGASEN